MANTLATHISKKWKPESKPTAKRAGEALSQLAYLRCNALLALGRALRDVGETAEAKQVLLKGAHLLTHATMTDAIDNVKWDEDGLRSQRLSEDFNTALSILMKHEDPEQGIKLALEAVERARKSQGKSNLGTACTNAAIALQEAGHEDELIEELYVEGIDHHRRAVVTRSNDEDKVARLVEAPVHLLAQALHGYSNWMMVRGTHNIKDFIHSRDLLKESSELARSIDDTQVQVMSIQMLCNMCENGPIPAYFDPTHPVVDWQFAAECRNELMGCLRAIRRGDVESECPICLDELNMGLVTTCEDERVHIMNKCFHVLHTKCLGQHKMSVSTFEQMHQCPVCRTNGNATRLDPASRARALEEYNALSVNDRAEMPPEAMQALDLMFKQ